MAVSNNIMNSQNVALLVIGIDLAIFLTLVLMLNMRERRRMEGYKNQPIFLSIEDKKRRKVLNSIIETVANYRMENLPTDRDVFTIRAYDKESQGLVIKSLLEDKDEGKFTQLFNNLNNIDKNIKCYEITQVLNDTKCPKKHCGVRIIIPCTYKEGQMLHERMVGRINDLKVGTPSKSATGAKNSNLTEFNATLGSKITIGGNNK